MVVDKPRGWWRRLIGRWTLLRTLVLVVAVAGAVVLSYPSTAQWLSDANQAVDLSGYVHKMTAIPDPAKQQLLAGAHEFNQRIPAGPLRDPYTTSSTGGAVDYATYQQTLDTDDNGTMGTLSIPVINAYLPILHGTDPATLDVGVGHLFGSSLPVGGPSTHAVLTAHSGMVARTLFNNLDQLQAGDQFIIRVLDEVLFYEVDQLLTVEPDQLDALQQIDGGDYVTLVTCTPTGINTHRLLVRGHHIPTPEPLPADAQLSAFPGPGFPWWALAAPAAALIAVFATRPRTSPPAGPRAGAHRRARVPDGVGPS